MASYTISLDKPKTDNTNSMWEHFIHELRVIKYTNFMFMRNKLDFVFPNKNLLKRRRVG